MNTPTNQGLACYPSPKAPSVNTPINPWPPSCKAVDVEGSSLIRRVAFGYNNLYIEFQPPQGKERGSVYTYKGAGVTALGIEMLASKSRGAFFNKNIKGQFYSELVRPTQDAASYFILLVPSWSHKYVKDCPYKLTGYSMSRTPEEAKVFPTLNAAMEFAVRMRETDSNTDWLRGRPIVTQHAQRSGSFRDFAVLQP